MRLVSRMRCGCAKQSRIIGVLLLASLLAACSTVKLAYNNLPELSYWWLDGYVDFDGAQTPRMRDELAQLLAWHRRSELPKVTRLLQKAEALATDDITPAQVCEVGDEIRARLLAVAERAEAAGAELALSLSDAQLQQLERKYAKVNDEYRKDWLALSTAGQQDKRYDRLLERNEDFYGTLDKPQRELLRQQVAQSAFSAQRVDAERRNRQQEALALLRGFRGNQTPPAEVRAALRAYVQRIADPPPGPWRTYQQSMLQEGCRNVATLHNGTSAAQRERAVRRLQAYQTDTRQLALAQ
ncbi:DUF6279 family lipoprotein [Variovorax sp. RT4R15]|uniref:DUF6279 family lipoprotein n=1 Tax=Variovorax sp. RT4R15 TaxID=3443737 RepID=UPI003F45B6DD